MCGKGNVSLSLSDVNLKREGLVLRISVWYAGLFCPKDLGEDQRGVHWKLIVNAMAHCQAENHRAARCCGGNGAGLVTPRLVSRRPDVRNVLPDPRQVAATC